ncbi:MULTISPECIES: DUF2157 domain-containing protein [Corallococcus]|uniref:DUF2157 domain-containing protein n=1 Tax=Corallococcus TaxID=83461 RepID=UPI00117CCB00|nr:MULTISPECIES: DUF2157 domain-containing protein [Corallococcus]NBD14163.1 DUF2157 domain-containing protein [Corallococcus silvisoli]TSC32163.1 DUF2157 domain-containing protein [Corallococcus sp. Z5C101001]
MPRDFLDLEATPERLQALVDARILSPDAYGRALHLAVATPSRSAWRAFLSTTLMALGALLVLAGVVYFFAFNWAELGRFAKLGLVALGITGAAVGAWRLGERPSGQFSLLAAAVLVGPLLAVFGQTYQTGADPYELFIGWGVLILPWVALARFTPLWLLQLVLINTGLILFWGQRMHGFESRGTNLALILGLLNGFAWATYEHFANRRVPWLQGRWMPRVLALMAMGPLVGMSILFIVSQYNRAFDTGLSLLLLLGAFAAIYALHRHLHGELFLLTVGALCAIILVTTAAGYFLIEVTRAEELTLFLLPLLLICEVGLAVYWLRHESQATGVSEET